MNVLKGNESDFQGTSTVHCKSGKQYVLTRAGYTIHVHIINCTTKTIKPRNVVYIHPASLLFEQGYCTDWIFFNILSLTKIIAFSGTLVTCYLLSFEIIAVNPAHFLLTDNIKRGNHGIFI